MELIISRANCRDIKYQILGQESQAVQVILMPGQQIITAQSSIQYMSEKIAMQNKYTLRERFKQLFTGERRMETIVENGGDSIGYLGLTQSTGRVIVVDQAARFRAMKRQFLQL